MIVWPRRSRIWGCPQIETVRGRGLLRGIVLSVDIAPRVAEAMLDSGWIINAPRPSVLRLAPPLVVTDEIIDRFAQVLGVVIAQESAP